MLDSSMKKSAGFAFVEFRKHEEAKDFIEHLSENPQQLMNKPYVIEFAIQDSRKLLKLKKSKKITKTTEKEQGQKKGERGG